MAQLNEHVAHLRREFDQRADNEERDRVAHMPTVVSNVIWGRQLESKVKYQMLFSTTPYVRERVKLLCRALHTYTNRSLSLCLFRLSISRT